LFLLLSLEIADTKLGAADNVESSKFFSILRASTER
jgi:hypothetical protein